MHSEQAVVIRVCTILAMLGRLVVLVSEAPSSHPIACLLD